MVTEAQVLDLQQEYTDKYVMVDDSRPELARFRDVVGVIKTINMNGRALVEFQDYHSNIGWFDIGLDFVRVVPKPDPNAVKVAKEKPAAKPVAGKEAAAKPAGGKTSTSDILAAARANAGGAPAAKPAGGKMSTADILAASRKAAGGAAAPADEAADAGEEATSAAEPAVASKKAAGQKPNGPMPTSTADKIAYCRKVDAS